MLQCLSDLKKQFLKFLILVNNEKATVGFVYLQTADKNAMREYIALHYWRSKRWTEKHFFFILLLLKNYAAICKGPKPPYQLYVL